MHPTLGYIGWTAAKLTTEPSLLYPHKYWLLVLLSLWNGKGKGGPVMGYSILFKGGSLFYSFDEMYNKSFKDKLVVT